MKKIAFITTNKILAQSLEISMATLTIQCKFFLLHNLTQIFLDLEVLEIDVALIDMGLFDTDCDKGVPFSFFLKIHNVLPDCQLLLLVSQEDKKNRAIASEAKQKQIIDDFVFYDASLKYLLSKLTSL